MPQEKEILLDPYSILMLIDELDEIVKNDFIYEQPYQSTSKDIKGRLRLLIEFVNQDSIIQLKVTTLFNLFYRINTVEKRQKELHYQGRVNLNTLNVIVKSMGYHNYYDWRKQKNDNQERTSKYKEKYFEHVYNLLVEHDSKGDSLYEAIHSKGLDALGSKWLSAILPEIFFNALEDRDLDFGEKVSDVMVFNGDPNTYYKSKIKTNETQEVNLSEIKGTFIIHALSPLNDSIFLLCELGRFVRLSTALSEIANSKGNISNIPKAKIACTHGEWASLNSTVREMQNAGIKLDFEKARSRRLSLYTRLVDREDVKMMDVHDISNPFFSEVNGQHVEEQTAQYQIFFKEDVYEKIQQQYDKIIRTASEASEFIKNIVASFGDAGKENIKYVLLQRYAQLNYSGYLKIAIQREFDFDDTFNNLNKFYTKELKGYNLFGLYFSDYKVPAPVGNINSTGNQNFKDIETHPYFFPSGKLFSYFKSKSNENDLRKIIAQMSSNVILLDDFENDMKVSRLINRYSMISLAPIISDLLSFVFHFRFRKNKWIKFFKRQGLGEEFIQAWRNNDYVSYINNFSSLSFYTSDIPYYLFPYVWALGYYKNEHDRFKTFYIEFIIEILNTTQEVFQYDTGKY